MHRLLAALAGLFSVANSVSGQVTPPVTDTTTLSPPRWHIGFAADIGQPVGAFKQQVKNAAGGQAHALLRLDRHGLAALRMQAGWLNYGHESQRSCVGTAPHCRVAVNLTTANGILSLALGPQFTMPIGHVRAYGYGLVGISRFATVSGLGGGLVPDFVAADENFGDGGAVWSGGIGVQVPVHRRASIDLGLGYERHGERSYLIKGGLTDQPDGSLGFDIKRSAASLFAIRLGVTAAMGWGRRVITSAP
jgi:hypothetical protein